MKRIIVNKNDKYNYLTFIEKTELKSSQNDYLGKWICDCGKEVLLVNSKVLSGHTKSCGCFKSKVLIKRLTTHNKCYSSEYKTWQHIKERCNNPLNKNYNHYGGRGIIICDEWRDSFETFINDMGVKPTIKHSIDRIDNNGNYCKENCKWSTQIEQVKNRRTTIVVELDDQKLCLKDACKISGIKYENTLKHFRNNNKLPKNFKLINNGK